MRRFKFYRGFSKYMFHEIPFRPILSRIVAIMYGAPSTPLPRPIWYRELKGVFVSLGCPFPSKHTAHTDRIELTGKMMTECACSGHLERKTIYCYPTIAITF